MIRYGNYTIYCGREMMLQESRYEYNISDDEKLFSISYLPEFDNALDGFKKLNNTEMVTKAIYFKDLTNAFQIFTKASYKGSIFDTFSFYKEEQAIGLNTSNESVGKELNFLVSTDSDGKPYYLKTVKLSEIEELWEERKPTRYNLPMPDQLELRKDIKI